jgi:hypothetical protein
MVTECFFQGYNLQARHWKFVRSLSIQARTNNKEAVMPSRCYALVVACVVGSSTATAADVQFDAADFAPFAGDGPATLDGEAFAKTKGGELRTCMGETVFLIPANAFSISVINRFAFGTPVAKSWAGPAAPYWRESTCDSQGKFTFAGLPPGNWIAYGEVRWRVLGDLQLAKMAKKIVLKAGPNRVILGPQEIRPLFGGWNFN